MRRAPPLPRCRWGRIKRPKQKDGGTEVHLYLFAILSHVLLSPVFFFLHQYASSLPPQVSSHSVSFSTLQAYRIFFFARAPVGRKMMREVVWPRRVWPEGRQRAWFGWPTLRHPPHSSTKTISGCFNTDKKTAFKLHPHVGIYLFCFDIPF